MVLAFIYIIVSSAVMTGSFLGMMWFCIEGFDKLSYVKGEFDIGRFVIAIILFFLLIVVMCVAGLLYDYAKRYIGHRVTNYYMKRKKKR